MKKSMFTAAVAAATLSLQAQTPVVSEATMAQDLGTRTVTVTYKLTEAPAVITLDILTNNVSIGAENITYLSGDVNKLVTSLGTTRTIQWQPDLAWPGNKVTNNSVTAVVHAWATNSTPNYLVADLLNGTVSYYVSSGALPRGGLTNDIYKTDWLVMRRIRATNVPWDMGATSSESAWHSGSTETNQVVTLTNDYYIGVYEVTQKQWFNLTGTNSQAFFNAFYDTYPGRAMENVSYVEIRENSSANYATESTACQYPNAPAPASFLGKLRTKTGIPFDLPSEAQWEYACRAVAGQGENVWNDGSSFLNGKLYWNNGANAELNNLARYIFDGGAVSTAPWKSADNTCTPQYGTAVVGSYAPNDWGLYDMHGNVFEWCLDWFADYYVYPTGHGEVNTTRPSSAYRAVRGGAYTMEPRICRSACRYNKKYTPALRSQEIGFRLAAAVTTPSK